MLLAGISWAGNACLKNWTDYLYHIPKVHQVYKEGISNVLVLTSNKEKVNENVYAMAVKLWSTTSETGRVGRQKDFIDVWLFDAKQVVECRIIGEANPGQSQFKVTKQPGGSAKSFCYRVDWREFNPDKPVTLAFVFTGTDSPRVAVLTNGSTATAVTKVYATNNLFVWIGMGIFSIFLAVGLLWVMPYIVRNPLIFGSRVVTYGLSVAFFVIWVGIATLTTYYSITQALTAGLPT